MPLSYKDIEKGKNLEFLEQAEQDRIDGMVANAIQIVKNKLDFDPTDDQIRPVVVEIVDRMYHREKNILTDDIRELINDIEDTTDDEGGVFAPEYL